MKLLGTLCAVLFAAAPILAEEKKADFDASKLEGKWKIVSGLKYGDKVEAKSIEGVVMIEKDKFTIKGDDMTHIMSFKLDTKASPITIDMVGIEGPAKDLKADGIIELKGDELKLCYAFPGEKRPTEFASKKDSKILLFVMKKMK